MTHSWTMKTYGMIIDQLNLKMPGHERLRIVNDDSTKRTFKAVACYETYMRYYASYTSMLKQGTAF